MNEDSFQIFEALYREELLKAVIAHPDDYCWPVEDAPNVATKMLAAIRRGTYNKDSKAFKAVCKQLGIKHTYTAIREYLEGK